MAGLNYTCSMLRIATGHTLLSIEVFTTPSIMTLLRCYDSPLLRHGQAPPRGFSDKKIRAEGCKPVAGKLEPSLWSVYSSK